MYLLGGTHTQSWPRWGTRLETFAASTANFFCVPATIARATRLKPPLRPLQRRPRASLHPRAFAAHGSLAARHRLRRPAPLVSGLSVRSRCAPALVNPFAIFFGAHCASAWSSAAYGLSASGLMILFVPREALCAPREALRLRARKRSSPYLDAAKVSSLYPIWANFVWKSRNK